MKRDLCGVPLELAVPPMLLDPPSVGDEWVRIAVDGVADGRHLSVTTNDGEHLCEDIALAHLLDVRVGVTSAAAREFELVGLSYIEHKLCAHKELLLSGNSVRPNNVAGLFPEI